MLVGMGGHVGPQPSPRRRRELPHRLARWSRRLLLGCAVGAGAWLVVSTLFVRTWVDPDAHPVAKESATTRTVERQLRARGVILRPPVRSSLNELVALWLRRPDLQRFFHESNGQPALQPLLAWAAAANDSSAIGLLDDRGNLEELAGRMGILPPDGNVIAPLTWTLRNRVRPMYPAEGLVGRLNEVWQARPDVRAQFTVDGRVEVRGLLFWAANVDTADPSYPKLHDVSSGLQRLLDDLEQR